MSDRDYCDKCGRLHQTCDCATAQAEFDSITSDQGPRSSPLSWFAVISKTRQEGTIARRDRSVQYEQNVEHLELIEKSAYDALMATHEEAVEASHKLLNERAYELDQLKAELEKAKQTELLLRAAIEGYIGDLKFYDKMWNERDEWIEKYKNIELANKEMSRNDHVKFGELLTGLTAARERIAELEKFKNEVDGIKAGEYFVVWHPEHQEPAKEFVATFERMREALERIMIATGTSTEAHHIARAALQPKGSE